jgi:hypothetical protein
MSLPICVLYASDTLSTVEPHSPEIRFRSALSKDALSFFLRALTSDLAGDEGKHLLHKCSPSVR